MAKTIAQIEKQMAVLQRQADALRKKQVDEVIAGIKEAIAQYGLTRQDLFGAVKAKVARAPKDQGRTKGAAKTKGEAKTKAAANGKAPSSPKYRDAAGNTWIGRGKRPDWFKAAIEAGMSPADLEIKG